MKFTTAGYKKSCLLKLIEIKFIKTIVLIKFKVNVDGFAVNNNDLKLNIICLI